LTRLRCIVAFRSAKGRPFAERKATLTEQLVQMEMEWPKLAAVVAGRDLQHPRTACGADANACRFLDCCQLDAVDDNLIHRSRPFRQAGLDLAAKSGTVRIVGAGLELLVTAADLGTAADNP